MTGHARNAPSDAKCWLNCAGKINRCKALGLESQAGEAAAEGTAAHWVSEMCFQFGFDPVDFLGSEIEADGYKFIVDDEMCEALQPGLDRIREFEGQQFAERKVDITKWVGPDEDGNSQRGTLDRGVVGEDEIVIGDLKYGRGIPVEVVNNDQIRIYALGFYEDVAKHLTKATKFRFIIDQPRNAQGGGEWTQTLEQLLEFGEYVRERAIATFATDAPCTPSKEACLWCPAARADGACPEYEAWNLAFCDITFDDLDAEDAELEMPDVEGMTVPRKRVLFDHLHVVRKFLDRVESTVRAEIFMGEGEKYGKKVVDGKRTNRKHQDEESSEFWLLTRGKKPSEIFTKKLITPAAIDKLLGKGKFPKSLISGGEPRPAIVSIEDDRPAIMLDGEVFENLENEFDDLDA